MEFLFLLWIGVLIQFVVCNPYLLPHCRFLNGWLCMLCCYLTILVIYLVLASLLCYVAHHTICHVSSQVYCFFAGVAFYLSRRYRPFSASVPSVLLQLVVGLMV